MGLANLSVGADVPKDFNTVIEIPAHAPPIKYEVDKDSGMLMVDRFMTAAMHYPVNYGFIPHTLAEDGDPADVLVITPFPAQAGSVVRCRPIALLRMSDEAGRDSKILAVPHVKTAPQCADINELSDVPEHLLKTISHFFEHYKDLEAGKWVKVESWEGRASAEAEILESVKRYQAD